MVNSADELLALSSRLRAIPAEPPAPRTARRTDVVVRIRIPKGFLRLVVPVRPRMSERVRASVSSWLYQ